MIPPPRLQASIRPRSLSTPSLPSHLQTRSFCGWRSLLPLWESKTDPTYNRARRYRTLQSRAKLIKNLRRRSQYYWDPDAKPILSLKPEHVRYASHWQLGGRPPRWTKEQAEKDEAERKEKGQEGYELSRRERMWKEQMEAMRRKIDADPYEAVFGKRFEPFWSPLVPTWMREEMGLPRDGEKGKRQADNVGQKQQKPIDVKKPEVQPKAPERKDSGVFAYSSETSWDSKSNQTRKSEWDSVSGKTSHYAYDPVSGRMMPVESPKVASLQGNESKAMTKAPSKSLVDEQPTRTRTRSVPAKSIAQQVDPRAGGEQNLETLTARDVRASVGKGKKPEQQPTSPQGQRSEMTEVEQQLKEFNASSQRLRSQIAGIVDHATTTPFVDHLQSSVQRHAEGSQNVRRPQPLQPAVQRMQSKDQPTPSEFDDSAVHEATEPWTATPNLPKSWDNQAEILQADRVKRTTSSRPPSTKRWLDDMNARKAAYDANKAAKQAADDAATAGDRAKLQKTNALLQSEVDAQKTAMRQHEDRYAHKIRALRMELDIAYKQSSVHADEFKDQISNLEKRLATAQRAASGSGLQSTEQRYREKVRSLKSELDVAYKQSSVHADEFTQRIKNLEAELARASKAVGDESQSVRKPELKAMQGEGDFCTNVTKFANSDKWYKQPSTMPLIPNEQVAKAEQRMRDQALVRNVREIYERAYGVIDMKHRQGEARKNDSEAGAYEDVEAKGMYTFKPDGLGVELQGKSCGDVLQGNAEKKQAKVAKKDVSEAEQLYAQTEAPGQYSFKDDGLASELVGKGCGDALQGNAVKKQAKVAQKDVSEVEMPYAQNESPGQYSFKDDGLSSELVGKGCGDALQGNAARKQSKTLVQTPVAVVDSSDAYEAAAGGKPAAQATTPRPAETNDLEAEMKGLGKEQPAYASDEYEAQIAGKDLSSAPSAKKVSSFEKDDLEAELQRKGKESAAYASDEYEAAAGAAQPKIKASTTIDKSKPNHDLEAELKSKGRERPEYASDAYETAAAAQTPSDAPNARLHTLQRSQQAKPQGWFAAQKEKVRDAVENKSARGVGFSNLEAELRSKGSEQPEYASDAYESVTAEPSRASAQAKSDGLPQAEAQKLRAQVAHLKQLNKDYARRVEKIERKAANRIRTAERAASQKVQQQAETTTVNPVDMTGKRDVVKPCTGNFASPTGFVNFDDYAQQIDSSGAAKPAPRAGISSSPIIHRAEPVYSGSRLPPTSKRDAKREAREARIAMREAEAGKDRRERVWIWRSVALGTGFGLLYAAAVVAEKAKTKREREGGVEMGRGRGRKWVLDEGEWKARNS